MRGIVSVCTGQHPELSVYNSLCDLQVGRCAERMFIGKCRLMIEEVEVKLASRRSSRIARLQRILSSEKPKQVLCISPHSSRSSIRGNGVGSVCSGISFAMCGLDEERLFLSDDLQEAVRYTTARPVIVSQDHGTVVCWPRPTGMGSSLCSETVLHWLYHTCSSLPL